MAGDNSKNDNRVTTNEATKFCVNDLLYYVEYKRKINATNDIISTCENFYSSDAIVEAKKQFFDAVGETDGLRCINRRGENATRVNLEDLIGAMNKCDNEGIVPPTFLSADYTKIPHGSDGNVSLNQIMHSIVQMKIEN